MQNSLKIGEELPAAHVNFVTLYSLAILAGFIHPLVTPVLLIVYMFITSLNAIIKSLPIIIGLVALSLMSTVFPPLAIVVFVIAVLLFFARLGVLIENGRAVLLGLFLYLMPILVSMGFRDFIDGFFKSPISLIILEAAFFGAVAHFSLIGLCKRGYKIENIIEIMGIAPLLIVSLVLPFLKINFSFGDVLPSVSAGNAGIADAALMGKHIHTTLGINDNPLAGKHIQTEGVNPKIITVDKYIRTHADGIVENNISYHGHNVQPTNTNIEIVKSHIRTTPDGIIENNISYQGEGKTISVTEKGAVFISKNELLVSSVISANDTKSHTSKENDSDSKIIKVLYDEVIHENIKKYTIWQAVSMQDLNLTLAIIENGEDINKLDGMKQTALDIAMNLGFSEIAEQLRYRGGKRASDLRK